MKNRVRGRNEAAPEFDFLAGVEIPIKSREIAAGDFEAKHMPPQENIACGPEIERDLVYLAWINQRGMFPRIPVAHAENPFRDIHREAIRRDIDKFASEIRVHSRGLGEKSRAYRAGNVQLLL